MAARSTTTPEPVNVAQAIAAVTAEIGPIGKDSVNEQQRFKYRGVDALVNHLNPVLAKHGVVVVPSVEYFENTERTTQRGSSQTMTTMLVRFKIYGPAGDYVEGATAGMALDMADKSANKAMTAAYKYILAQVFCIPYAELEDSDATTVERVPEGAASNEEEMARLDALAESVGKTREEISAVWRQGRDNMDMETFNGLPAAAIRALVRSIENYMRTQKRSAPAGAPNDDSPAPTATLGEPEATAPADAPESTQ
jgi:hypothetical protein